MKTLYNPDNEDFLHGNIRIAVVFNMDQKERYEYTDPLPLLRDMKFKEETSYSKFHEYKGLTLNVFSEENIESLFKEGLDNYSSITFFSDSLHTSEVQKIVKENEEKLLNYVKNGGGLIILFQGKKEEYESIPEKIRPAEFEDMRTIFSREELDTAIITDSNHQLFKIYHNIQESYFNKNNFKAKGYAQTLFKLSISSFPEETYISLIKDKNGNSLLLLGEYDLGRIMITTMCLDWHRLSQLLFNMILLASAKKIVAICPADCHAKYFLMGKSPPIKNFLIKGFEKKDCISLLENAESYNDIILDLNSIDEENKKEIEEIIKKKKNHLPNIFLIDDDGENTTLNPKILIDIDAQINRFLNKRDLRGIWDNSESKTVEILLHLYDEIAIKIDEDLINQVHQILLKGEILHLCMYLKLLLLWNRDEKKLDEVRQEILKSKPKIESSEILYQLRVLDHLIDSKFFRDDDIGQLRKSALEKVYKLLDGKTEINNYEFKTIIWTLRIMEKSKIKDLDLYGKCENYFIKALENRFIFVDSHIVIPIIELLESDEFSFSNLQHVKDKLYVIALITFFNLQNNPREEITRFSEFLGFLKCRIKIFEKYLPNLFISDAISVVELYSPKDAGISRYIKSSDLEHLTGVCKKREEQINFYKNLLKIEPSTNIDDLSMREKIKILCNVFSSFIRESTRKYIEYAVIVVVGAILYSFSENYFKLMNFSMSLSVIKFLVLFLVFLSFTVYLFRDDLKWYKKHLLTAILCIFTSLILSIFCVFVYLFFTNVTYSQKAHFQIKDYFRLVSISFIYINFTGIITTRIIIGVFGRFIGRKGEVSSDEKNSDSLHRS